MNDKCNKIDKVLDKEIANSLISAFESSGIKVKDDKGNIILSFNEACIKLHDKWFSKN